MFVAYTTELGRLRAFERELTAHYAGLLLRRHFDEEKEVFEHRRKVRRAILQAEEWHGGTGTMIQLPSTRAVEEDLARVA